LRRVALLILVTERQRNEREKFGINFKI
jgi:hypothetical protein